MAVFPKEEREEGATGDASMSERGSEGLIEGQIHSIAYISLKSQFDRHVLTRNVVAVSESLL